MRRQPQIATGENQSYGMGLMEDKSWGVAVIHHGGSMAVRCGETSYPPFGARAAMTPVIDAFRPS